MMLRKLIGWSVVVASLGIGFLGLPTGAAEPGATIEQDPARTARLRMDLWPGAGWLVQQFDRQVEIRFPGLDRDITLSGGLQGPLAERVAAVEAENRSGDSYLLLTLTCDCSIAVTGQAGTSVAIDVIEPDRPVATGPAPLRAPRPVARKGGASAKSQGQLDVDEARQRLMEQLLKAADAGIVDLKPDPNVPATLLPENAETLADMQSAQVSGKTSDERSKSEGAPADGNPLSAEMSAEPELADGTVQEGVALVEKPVRPAPTCHPETAYEFPDPNGEGGFAAQIGSLRAKLLGEFDAIDQSVAADIARLYLAAGMIEEARLTINELLPDHAHAELYRELADLLDGQPVQKDASVLLPNCEGPQQLWRSLAHAINGDGNAATRDVALIGQTFDLMPQSMRGGIAATIGEAAADAGEWDTARRMEAMINRSFSAAYGMTGPELLLAARLAQWHGRDDEAKKLLVDVRMLGGQSAAEATLRQAEATLREAAADTALDTTGLRQDLGALSLLSQDPAQAERAFELEVHLQDLAEGRDSAIALLSKGIADGLYPQEKFATKLSNLVQGSEFDERSRPLAIVYLEAPEKFGKAIDQDPFRKALLRSMTQLGLVTQAANMLRPSDLSDTNLIGELSGQLIAAGELDRAEQLVPQLPPGTLRDQLSGDLYLAQGRLGLAMSSFDAALSDTTMDDEQQLRIIDAQFAAAHRENDIEAMIASLTARLAVEPTASTAEEIAILSLDLGAPSMPEAAASILEEQAPDRFAMMERLFGSEAENEAPLTAESAQKLMDSVKDEISLIEDMLGDG